MAVDGGQNEVPQAVASKLPVQLNSPVQEVVPKADGVDVSYSSNGGQVVVERFDGCIVATTLPVAAAICPGEGSRLRALNDAFGYVPSITVAIGTRVKPACPAVLVQFSAWDNETIAYSFLEHNKRADRAPAGHGLITSTWESGAAQKMFEATDEEIVEKTMQSVRALFPEAAESVDMTHVTRWAAAAPNLAPGCYQSIAAFNSRPDQPPRIQFAGDFVGPPGQHGAVINGTRAASNLVEGLRAAQLIG
jgi:oxygen-dependent protoporphyrinogen oxidase